MSSFLKHIYRFTFALLGGLLTVSAWALQINQPVLLSRLGEPLKLQFFITDLSAAEEQLLTIAVAEAKVYETTQIKRVSGLDNIRFEVSKQANGDYLVQAYGSQPITEEHADLIIDFDWATGRRYMNIALEIQAGPPAAAPTPAAPTAQAASQPLGPAPTQEPAAPATAPDPAPVGNAQNSASPSATNASNESPAPAPTSGDSTKTSPPENTTTVEVKKGDTASKLLAGLANSDISLDQLLMALLQQNPNAFVNRNVNRLKAGSLVQLPTAEEAAALDRKEARDNLRLQATDFQAYRASLGATAPVAPQTTGSARESSGKLKGDVSAPANAPTDQLTLSKPGDSDAEKLAKQLQNEENAQQAKEVKDNLSQLGQLSQAASQFSEGIVARLPSLNAHYQESLSWAKHHVFELIAGAALFAAFLVGLSLMRDGRRPTHDDAPDDSHAASTADPDTDGSHDASAAQSLNLPPGLSLDLDDPSPEASTPSANAQAAHTTDWVGLSQDPKATVIDQGEDPYVMRLELADELWKLGQKQTALALAQEVVDQTHGETRDLAQRWLKDRA